VQNEAPASEVGAAIGLTRFFQSLGGAIGISLLQVFMTWRYGVLSSGASTPTALNNALVTTYNEAFLALAICIVIAFVFSLFFVGRMPRTPQEDPEHVGTSTTSGDRPLTEAIEAP
jgi:fucose permease